MRLHVPNQSIWMYGFPTRKHHYTERGLAKRYILFGQLFVKSQKPLYCKAPTKTADGLIFSDCSHLYPGTLEWTDFNKHENIPYDVEYIDLSYTKCSIHENSFSQFENLKRIKMYHNYIVSKNVIRQSPEWFEGIYNHLFADTNLEVIEFLDCQLIDENKFVYPLSLRSLNLSYNIYNKLDLTSCEDLEELNIQRNNLDNLPKFSDPVPPLRYLNVGSNPLRKMTVNDIAALCWLKQFIAELNYKSWLVQKSGKCECERIQNWTTEIGLPYTGISCYEPAEDEIINCSNYTLDEARKIRQSCIKANTGVSYVLRKIKRYKYRLLSVFLGLLIFAIIVYMVYRIHRGTLTKSSDWKGRQSKASAAEEGEEEEEEKSD